MKRFLFIFLLLPLLTLNTRAQTITIPNPFTVQLVAPPPSGPYPFTNPQIITNVTQSGTPPNNNNYIYTGAGGGGDGVVSANSWGPGVPFTIIYTDPAISGGMPIGAGTSASIPTGFSAFVGELFGGFSGNTGQFGNFHATDNAGHFFVDDGAGVTGSTSAMAKMVFDGTNVTFYVTYTGPTGWRQFTMSGTPLAPYAINNTVSYYLLMGAFSTPAENDNVLVNPAL